ncbi:MAG: hypothetical protein AAF933_13885 [Pseudomonadota bacterium]
MSRGVFITVYLFISTAICAVTPRAAAQAPLSIEQLIMDASRWQLTAGIDERSAHQPVGELRDLGLRTSLRYGITAKLEVNAGVSQRRTDRRVPGDFGRDRTQIISMGSTWLLHPEGRWPALLTEARWDLFLPSARETDRSAGGVFAATVYRSIDPVVLSLRASVHRRSAFADNGRKVTPGSSWRVEPMVNFAVNPRVTLLTGLTFSRHAATRLDGGRLLAPRHDLRLRLGIGLAPTPGSNLFLSGDIGSAAVGIGLEWFFEL